MRMPRCSRWRGVSQLSKDASHYWRSIPNLCQPGESALRLLILLMLTTACRFVAAETVQVKYHGPVSLDSFACVAVTEDSDVSRICYDAVERYMLIFVPSDTR